MKLMKTVRKICVLNEQYKHFRYEKKESLIQKNIIFNNNF